MNKHSLVSVKYLVVVMKSLLKITCGISVRLFSEQA